MQNEYRNSRNTKATKKNKHTHSQQQLWNNKQKYKSLCYLFVFWIVSAVMLLANWNLHAANDNKKTGYK